MDLDVGMVLPVPDGFLTALWMTTPPVNDGVPRWSERQRKWLSGYFVLRTRKSGVLPVNVSAGENRSAEVREPPDRLRKD